MASVSSRLKALYTWVSETKYFGSTMAVIGIALAISFQPRTPEPVIRLTGLILQLLGICTVAWGISETRSLFGHPSLASKVKGWLKRFPFWRQPCVASVKGSGGGVVGGKCRAYGTHSAGENPTIKEVAEALQRNVQALHERINQTQDEMEQETGKVLNRVKKEEESRLSQNDKLSKRLEATGTGGVHISAIGAAWLFVGSILSTAALEIAAMLK